MRGTLDLTVTRVLEAGGLALVIHAGEAGGALRGCAAASDRRLLALRDRQPVGNELRKGVSSVPEHWVGGFL
jgi:hypothetical protein